MNDEKRNYILMIIYEYVIITKDFRHDNQLNIRF